MATWNKFNQYVADRQNGVHNWGGHAFFVALCAAANAPIASNTVLANLTQINYSGLSSLQITITSSAQVAGVYKLVITDLVLTASAPVQTFRYVVIYNDTPTSPTDPLVAWLDFGSDVTMKNPDTFTIDFDGVNGALTGT